MPVGCNIKPYEDQNPSTYKTSIPTSKKPKPALMLLGGKICNYSENLTEHTHEYIGKWPGRTPCYQCEK
jgi:hypothetical protein